MLAPQCHNVGTPLCGIQKQGKGKACAGADRVSGFESLDVGCCPSPIAIGLDLGAPDPLRRVIDAHALINAVLHQRTNRLEEVVGCLRRPGLRCDHALDVFGLEKRYALVAVLLTKPFQDIPAGAPSLRRQLTERPGVEITHHRGGHGTRLHGLGGDLNTRSSLNRLLISGHELRRPWKAGQGHPFEAGTPEVPAWLAMSVGETLHKFRRPAHQRRSHSFPPCVGGSCTSASLVNTSMSPCALTFTPATCSPAAITAFTARVTSRCRNADGGREVGLSAVITRPPAARCCRTRAPRSAHGAR